MEFDIAPVRRALLTLRKDAVGSRRKLAAKIDLAQSTIQNAETGTDMTSLDTVARIILGCGSTLGRFFSALDATTHEPTRKTLNTPAVEVQNPPRVSPMVPYEADDVLAPVPAALVEALSRSHTPSLDDATVERIVSAVVRRLKRSAEARRPQPKRRAHRRPGRRKTG